MGDKLLLFIFGFALSIRSNPVPGQGSQLGFEALVVVPLVVPLSYLVPCKYVVLARAWLHSPGSHNGNISNSFTIVPELRVVGLSTVPVFCPWPFAARLVLRLQCLRSIGKSLGNIKEVRRSAGEESYAEDRVPGNEKVRTDTIRSEA